MDGLLFWWCVLIFCYCGGLGLWLLLLWVWCWFFLSLYIDCFTINYVCFVWLLLLGWFSGFSHVLFNTMAMTIMIIFIVIVVMIIVMVMVIITIVINTLISFLIPFIDFLFEIIQSLLITNYKLNLSTIITNNIVNIIYFSFSLWIDIKKRFEWVIKWSNNWLGLWLVMVRM